MLSEDLKKDKEFYCKVGWGEFSRHDFSNIIDSVIDIEKKILLQKTMIEQLEIENEMLLNYLKGSHNVYEELLETIAKNKLACDLIGALKMIEINNFLESKK
jgi:hypothetical protein